MTICHFAFTSAFEFVAWYKARDVGVDSPRTPTPRAMSAIPFESTSNAAIPRKREDGRAESVHEWKGTRR